MTLPPVSPEPGFVIAIDGPAASGKSSTARAVAKELGIRHGDSGALYRAATAARIGRGGDPSTWTEESVLKEAKHVTVRLAEGRFAVMIGMSDASNLIRSPAVTAHVSLVAKMPRVREWVNDRMRECASLGAVVVDGRDMGTAVFPNAALKIWLVAHPRERARRRSVEMLGRIPSDAELEAEVAALAARDSKDQEQTKPAPDAIEIDTTSLTPADQIRRIVGLALERLGPG
jgi:cytidylate kinase